MSLVADSPYCEIRNTHASAEFLGEKIFKEVKKEKYSKESLVKSRNEPCKMVEVLRVVAKIKGVEEEELAAVSYKNTCKLFGIDENLTE